jgi:hypothetical protein
MSLPIDGFGSLRRRELAPQEKACPKDTCRAQAYMPCVGEVSRLPLPYFHAARRHA